MTLAELRWSLRTAHEHLALVERAIPPEARDDTVFALGQALGTIAKAMAMVERDMNADNPTANR